MREIVWGRATDLVILSPPHAIAFLRLTRRTLFRILSRRELWNGNRESVRLTLSRDSIVVWFLKTYRRRYRTFIRQHRHPRYRHLRLHVIRCPRDERRLLSDLRRSSTLRPPTTERAGTWESGRWLERVRCSRVAVAITDKANQASAEPPGMRLADNEPPLAAAADTVRPVC